MKRAATSLAHAASLLILVSHFYCGAIPVKTGGDGISPSSREAAFEELLVGSEEKLETMFSMQFTRSLSAISSPGSGRAADDSPPASLQRTLPLWEFPGNAVILAENGSSLLVSSVDGTIAASTPLHAAANGPRCVELAHLGGDQSKSVEWVIWGSEASIYALRMKGADKPSLSFSHDSNAPVWRHPDNGRVTHIACTRNFCAVGSASGVFVLKLRVADSGLDEPPTLIQAVAPIDEQPLALSLGHMRAPNGGGVQHSPFRLVAGTGSKVITCIVNLPSTDNSEDLTWAPHFQCSFEWRAGQAFESPLNYVHAGAVEDVYIGYSDHVEYRDGVGQDVRLDSVSGLPYNSTGQISSVFWSVGSHMHSAGWASLFASPTPAGIVFGHSSSANLATAWRQSASRGRESGFKLFQGGRWCGSSPIVDLQFGPPATLDFVAPQQTTGRFQTVSGEEAEPISWDGPQLVPECTKCDEDTCPNFNVFIQGHSTSRSDCSWKLVGGRTQSDHIASAAAINMASLWAITKDGGICVINITAANLAWSEQWHASEPYPRHNFRGMVSASSLPIAGNTSAFEPTFGESDGLWTGMYMVGLAAKAQINLDDNVVDLLQHHLQYMKLLYDVTGVPGLPARSAQLSSPSPVSNTAKLSLESPPRLGNRCKWINSTTVPGWMWLDDTSSDTVAGHMAGLWSTAFSLKQSHPHVAQAAADLVISLTDHILRHNFTLVDETEQRTTWGFWGPADLVSEDNYDERGPNSVQILSYLMAAFAWTGDAKYQAAYQQLSKAGYEDAIINNKITTPDDDNYSDDELTFLPMMVACEAYSKNWDWISREKWQVAIQRTWEIASVYKPSLWSSISAICQSKFGKPQALEYRFLWSAEQDSGLNWRNNCFEDLSSWPLDWIDWDYNTTMRHDVALDPYRDRGNKLQLTTLLPRNERTAGRWNSNPWSSAGGGNGGSEFDSGAWMAGYWMCRKAMVVTAASK